MIFVMSGSGGGGGFSEVEPPRRVSTIWGGKDDRHGNEMTEKEMFEVQVLAKGKECVCIKRRKL
jgi:hypothetical protein